MTCFTKYGGRRFLLCLGCAAMCSIHLALGQLDPENFRWIVLGTLGAYIAGNTYQKAKGIPVVTEQA